MTPLGALARGREAFARQQWKEAFVQLSAADGERPLEPADLEHLATAAYLAGDDAGATDLWHRIYEEHVDRGELEGAVRCGGWLSLHLLLQGETARSAGWLARTERLLEELASSRPGQGYLRIVSGLASLSRGDTASASESFEEAYDLAGRSGDADLAALGLLSRGQARIHSGEIEAGVALLDEAMTEVTAGRVSPIVRGIVYCAVILTCQGIFDVRRAREWTRALDEWSASQTDLVPFRGRCLVHRAEVLQLQGQWSDALEEAKRACEWLSAQSERSVGHAWYQRAELHRLRGEFELAERMYREAARADFDPQPGLALLRLAQGRLDAAEAAIRLVVETGGPGPSPHTRRPDVLAARVEIMLAGEHVENAREAADELARMASAIGAPLLHALSAQARGSVRLAEGDAQAALAVLREAWTHWQQLDAPYESARVRVLIGAACRQLGDHDGANIHLDAARSVFERLGAQPDVDGLERGPERAEASSLGGLTGREREVLALVASGKTNRQIARDLFISEHTVARHLSNIFNKIGVTSRTAASAFAFERGLVRHGPF